MYILRRVVKFMSGQYTDQSRPEGKIQITFLGVFDIADYKYNTKFYRYNIETLLSIDLGANQQPACIKNYKSRNILWSFLSLMTSCILAFYNFAYKQLRTIRYWCSFAFVLHVPRKNKDNLILIYRTIN